MKEESPAFAIRGAGGSAVAPIHRFSHEAMGSIFEIFVAGQEAEYARQASDAAFEELDRLYHELNRYSPTSDVSQINHLRAGQGIRVGVATYECLKIAARVSADTGGAFDVTVGRLFALWKPQEGVAPPQPTDAEIAAARKATGIGLLVLCDDDFSVGAKADGVQVDLGGIGKGFAVDQMAATLREWSVSSALLHGGGSSVYAMGAPAGKDGWTIVTRNPENASETLAVITLKDESLSGSGIRPNYLHIIDPRTGRPATGNMATWARAKSGAVADALSTAFLIFTPDEVRAYCEKHLDAAGMIYRIAEAEHKVYRYGKWDAVTK